MTTKEKIQFLLVRSIGNFFLLLALYGVYITFSPVISEELRVRIEKAKGITYQIKSESEVKIDDILRIKNDRPGALQALLVDEKVHILVPKDTLFSILIPKIGASERIIPNIDPSNQGEYSEALKSGIAHAKGTMFPGLPGSTYLFAHSAANWWNAGRNNAVFYLIKDLEMGDEVIIFFENRRYNYEVSSKYIADPAEVSLLVNSRGTDEQLILQTCWPPGTTWKRLFVVARPKSS